MPDKKPESSTRELLIEATAKRLWREDESDLRILDICKETNLSTSVIYGHFRSRQGLIDAALLRLFSFVTDEIMRTLHRTAAGPHPTGSFVDTFQEFLSDAEHEHAITQQRQMFFRVSATALSRPSIRPGFLELYNDYTARVDELFASLVDHGLLGDRLTGHQWAMFFESLLLSRAFHDLLQPWDELHDWVHVANELFSTENQAVSAGD